MTNAPVGLYLFHIAESFRNVLEYTDGVSFEQFAADKMRKDAVIRNYEIIGEAALDAIEAMPEYKSAAAVYA